MPLVFMSFRDKSHQARPIPPWGNPHRLSKLGIYRGLVSSISIVSGRLLDLGCGTKPYASMLATQTSSWYGYDIKTSNQEAGGADVLGDVQLLPFHDATFDTVLCTEVAEHIPDPPALFAEIVRVLKPGGHLLMTTPFHVGLHEEPRDFYRYTLYALTRLATSSNLKVIRCTPTTGVFGVLGELISYHVPEPRSGVAKGAIHIFRAAIQFPLWHLDGLLHRPRDPLGYVLIGQRIE